ncbi:MAG: protein kinase family protein [Verrucomicrobia bacterium]|nr:protein kinase family protein [Verrucomicrobiota bacterium]
MGAGETIRAAGQSIWTQSGELKKSRSDTAKTRILLGSGKDTRLAIVIAKSDHSSVVQAIKSKLTRVSLEVEAAAGPTTVEVNIGSLAKRINISFRKIIISSIKGNLSEVVKNRAREIEEEFSVNDQIYDSAQTVAKESNLSETESEHLASQAVKTARKGDKLAKGFLLDVGNKQFFAQLNSAHPLVIMSCDFKAKPLGEGSFGEVFAATLLSQNNANIVVKFAKAEGGLGAERDVMNEYNTLREIHANGHIRGIQRPPLLFVDLRTRGLGIGYIISAYDFDLRKVSSGEKPLSEEHGLQCCQDLVSGLLHLHTQKRVHGDIKPANACLENGEFALADFGGARTHDKIDLQHPLGVITKEYTSDEDIERDRAISQQYRLHLVASKQITDPIKIIDVLGDAYLNPNTPQDVKDEIKPLLEYLFSQQMDKVDFEFWLKDENQKSADEKILAKLVYPLGFDQPQEKIPNKPDVDLSRHLLSEMDLASLKKEAILLNEQHDVYSLGITLTQVLAPNAEFSDKIQIISQKYGDDVAKTLSQMCSQKAEERPPITEVPLNVFENKSKYSPPDEV